MVIAAALEQRQLCPRSGHPRRRLPTALRAALSWSPAPAQQLPPPRQLRLQRSSASWTAWQVRIPLLHLFSLTVLNRVLFTHVLIYAPGPGAGFHPALSVLPHPGMQPGHSGLVCCAGKDLPCRLPMWGLHVLGALMSNAAACAGRMDHLSVEQSVPAASEVSNTVRAAAAPKPKRAAARKKPIVLSDSEDEEDESLPSSASEPDEASDSEDDFSPEKKPKTAGPAKKYVPRSRCLLCQSQQQGDLAGTLCAFESN